MDGKVWITLIFVFAGIGCGIAKDLKGMESLWVLQVGFLFTANLMMLEYAWRARTRTKRLFVFPILGLTGIFFVIASNLAF